VQYVPELRVGRDQSTRGRFRGLRRALDGQGTTVRPRADRPGDAGSRHVRWSYQSCDFRYKVWGDSAVEDFYFYPDGFGTRVLSLQSAPEGDYELSEFIVLTPPFSYPFDVLPPNMVDILSWTARSGSSRFRSMPRSRETR